MSDFSVLIIVVMTGDKLYAVSRPFKAHIAKFNRKIASIISLLVLILSALINSHFLYTYSLIYITENLNTDKNVDVVSSYDYVYAEVASNIVIKPYMFCNFKTWNNFYNYYWPYIDASIYSFIPVGLLSVFNIFIIRHTIKAENERLKLIETQHSNFAHKRTIFGSVVSIKGKIRLHEPKNSLSTKQQREDSSNEKNHNPITDSKRFKENILINKNAMHHNTIYADAINDKYKKRYFSGEKSSLFKKTSQTEILKKNSSVVTLNMKSNKNHLITASKCKSYKTRLTLTLLLINISFCVMSMPVVILQIFYYKKKEKIFDHIRNNSSENIEHEIHNYFKDFDLIKIIAELLQYLNHVVNFFLYCLSGETFRKEVFACFTKFKKNLIRSKNNF